MYNRALRLQKRKEFVFNLSIVVMLVVLGVLVSKYINNEKELQAKQVNLNINIDQSRRITTESIDSVNERLDKIMADVNKEAESVREIRMAEEEKLRAEQLAREEAEKRRLETEEAKKAAPKDFRVLKSIDKSNSRNVYSWSLRNLTGLTEDEYRKILEGTDLISLASELPRIEKQYQINGLFLLSLAALESGYGTSSIARSKNNITGFQAYDSATHMAKVFDSYADCIEYTAAYLDENYLSEDGKYHKGHTINALNYYYSSSDQWGAKISHIMKKSLDKLKQ